jgi:uncharacterized protein YcbX
MAAALVEIRRYPVKSLGGEALAEVALTPGRGLVNDRRYALVPAAPGAPVPEPGWRPKARCIALVRHAALARLAARFDDAAGILTVAKGGRNLAQGRPEDAAERTRLEAVLNGELAREVGSGAALVAAGANTMLTDVDAPFVSLVNAASVRALQTALGAALDPLRFRANFLFDGAPAWSERRWIGRRIRLGGAVLEVVEPIERCAATEVNPATALRDRNVLRALADGFGHVEMGIYAKVVGGGVAAVAARLAVAS